MTYPAPGLPPDGDPRQFVGFTRSGHAELLEWIKHAGKWCALGYRRKDQWQTLTWASDDLDHIVSHYPVDEI